MRKTIPFLTIMLLAAMSASAQETPDKAKTELEKEAKAEEKAKAKEAKAAADKQKKEKKRGATDGDEDFSYFPKNLDKGVKEGGLVPDNAFRKIMLNDIALMNGLDKTADFTSFVNVSLVDDPGIKLNIAARSVSNSKQDVDKAHTYFHNIGVEMNLKEDLSDLFKNESRQFKGSISYTGTLFFNKATRFKFDAAARRTLAAKLAVSDISFDNLAPDWRTSISGLDGKTTYYCVEEDNTLTEVYETESKAKDKIFGDAEWNTKKYFWLAFTGKVGMEGLNFYESALDTILREFKPVAELDVSFNFYHWTNPDRGGFKALGSKFISAGIGFAYQPQDDLSQKNYITIANDSTSTIPISNKPQSTKAAYDLSTYSEVFRISPHFDWYNFVTKNQAFGLHLGVRGKLDTPINAPDSVSFRGDLEILFGAVVNIKGCYGTCKDDKKDSRVSFEIQVVAENIVANDKAKKHFREFLSPRFKVGIPFTSLHRKS